MNLSLTSQASSPSSVLTGQTQYSDAALQEYASFENGYLTAADSGYAVIGNGLSDYLHAGVGDTLVLMGQGYHGTSAAGLFVVKGIVSMPQPEIDNRFVYLTLDDARYLYAAPGWLPLPS